MNIARVAVTALTKARRYARNNPDKARKALTAVETQVNRRTGGKYSEQVRKSADALGGQLGVRPSETIVVDKTQRPGDST